jgi:hypothetical protein
VSRARRRCAALASARGQALVEFALVTTLLALAMLLPGPDGRPVAFALLRAAQRFLSGFTALLGWI